MLSCITRKRRVFTILENNKKVMSKKMDKVKDKINDIIKKKGGISLDIGAGSSPNEGFVSMDVRPLPGIDIVHNLEKYPWPIPDEVCTLVHASHVLEHITPNNTDPRLVGLFDLLLSKKVISKADVKKYVGEYEIFGNFIRFMDEVWRITKMGGQFHFVVPYAGSTGYWQDPTHVNPISEITVMYFDPTHESHLWEIYKPKPWKFEINAADQHNGFLEVVLRKLNDKDYE